MKYVIAYLILGVIAVVQATIRNWRWTPLRGLEGICVAVGAVFLWLPILISELPAIYRRIRYKER